MPGCCVPDCNNRTEKGVRMFRMPQGKINEARAQQWKCNIRRDVLPESPVVCEKHFTEDQFENRRLDGKRPLRWNAVPTLFQKRVKKKRNVKGERGPIGITQKVIDVSDLPEALEVPIDNEKINPDSSIKDNVDPLSGAIENGKKLQLPQSNLDTPIKDNADPLATTIENERRNENFVLGKELQLPQSNPDKDNADPLATTIERNKNFILIKKLILPQSIDTPSKDGVDPLATKIENILKKNKFILSKKLQLPESNFGAPTKDNADPLATTIKPIKDNVDPLGGAIENGKKLQLPQRNLDTLPDDKTIIKNERKKNVLLSKKLQFAEKKNKILEREMETLQQSIAKVFTQDQIDFLKKGTVHRGSLWKAKTINNALRMYLSCGITGYKELLKQNYPLPSVRTLQRRMKHLNFENDNLHDLFLSEQEKLDDEEVDEMAIKPALQFDEDEENSTEEIVFMVESFD